MSLIYLDNAATTFPKPAYVIDAVNDCISNFAFNPHRGYNTLVGKANFQLEQTRNLLAENLKLNSAKQVIFVPSATHGINLVIQGFPLSLDDTVYISPFEHNAVVRCVEFIRKTTGINVKKLPLDKNFELNLDEVFSLFASYPPKLVIVTHASNVTGDILPIKEIIQTAHSFGGKVLVDAAQTAGLYTPEIEDYDYLAFSSHKGLYGIPGAGVLVIKENTPDLKPFVFGGTGFKSEETEMPATLPEKYEAGTQPLPAIISMNAGINWLNKIGLQTIKEKISSLTHHLLEGLSSLNAQILGHHSKIGNIGIVSFNLLGLTPQEVNKVLDEEGFCVRSGLHCSPLAHETLGTIPNGTVRVSFSYFNEKQEVDRLLDVLKKIAS
jgi:cysteine desulfurase family protein